MSRITFPRVPLSWVIAVALTFVASTLFFSFYLGKQGSERPMAVAEISFEQGDAAKEIKGVASKDAPLVSMIESKSSKSETERLPESNSPEKALQKKVNKTLEVDPKIDSSAELNMSSILKDKSEPNESETLVTDKVLVAKAKAFKSEESAGADPVVDIKRVHVKNSPTCHDGCLEKTKSGLLLPCKASNGLRPFDVYQSDMMPTDGKTYLTIIISDLGLDKTLIEKVKADFPNTVTCAFLPLGNGIEKEHELLRQKGYETLMMLPMEPMDYPLSEPGPGTLLTNQPIKINRENLHKILSSFTGYMGVMSYMGSRFARSKGDFIPVLKEFEKRGLSYFEPRFMRSGALKWKGENMPYFKGQFDVLRGQSIESIKAILKTVNYVLGEKKNSVVISVQADAVSFEVIKNWVATELPKDVVLVPLSVQIEAQDGVRHGVAENVSS